jgi:hypothetical protein
LASRHGLREDGILVAPHQKRAGGGIGAESDDFFVFFAFNAMVQPDVHANRIVRSPAPDPQQIGDIESQASECAVLAHRTESPAQAIRRPTMTSRVPKVAAPPGVLGVRRGETCGRMKTPLPYPVILASKLEKGAAERAAARGSSLGGNTVPIAHGLLILEWKKHVIVITIMMCMRTVFPKILSVRAQPLDTHCLLRLDERLTTSLARVIFYQK